MPAFEFGRDGPDGGFGSALLTRLPIRRSNSGSSCGHPACMTAANRPGYYRPRYLNIQRLNYLWTIRHSGKDHRQPDYIT
jgi:hypothetical protein